MWSSSLRAQRSNPSRGMGMGFFVASLLAMTASSQPKQCLQEIAHRFARLLRRGGVAADMRVELDAGILVAERRLRIGVHQHTAFAFPEMTVACGLGIG